MQDVEAKGGTGFSLPLVSVVIVNYNYAAFLPASVGSVFAQTYRNVECIVLDNASTDDSLAVLDRLRAEHPGLVVRSRADNAGQFVPSVEGFEATSGDYVVFLDADDVLLPAFLATQIAVLLSSRIAVGFSCCDMAQTSGERLVLTSFASFNGYVRSREGQSNDICRPLDELPVLAAYRDQLADVPSDLIHFCDRDRVDWPWASTSAFVFRRDALAVVLKRPVTGLKYALDVYLARGLNVLFGSLTIDRSLCVYRMHRANIFSRHAQLNHWFNWDCGHNFDQERVARLALVDNMFDGADFVLDRLPNHDDFFRALLVLAGTSTKYPGDQTIMAHVKTRLTAAAPALEKKVGAATVTQWQRRLRLPFFFTRRYLAS